MKPSTPTRETPRKPNCVALIPARSGSVRIPDKNIRRLAGHPLLAYAVSASLSAPNIQGVYVVTDSSQYGSIANHYGAEVLIRPASTATSEAPDIRWVEWALDALTSQGTAADIFAIVRPTSPFRSSEDLSEAIDLLVTHSAADSVRGVKKIAEHPFKSWVQGDDGWITPFVNSEVNGIPGHSSQYVSLPPLLIQDGSMDVSWTRVVRDEGRITGAMVLPWISARSYSVDVNSEMDWLLAEMLIEKGLVLLPKVSVPSFPCD